MQIKFMPKDVIGKKQPTKVGDTFRANFMGHKMKFVVVEYHTTFFMCETSA